MTYERQLDAHILSSTSSSAATINNKSSCLFYVHDFPRFQTIKHCKNTATAMQAAITTAELNEQATMLIETGHYDSALEILEFAMNTLRRRQEAMTDITSTVVNHIENVVHQEQSMMELDEMRAILMYNMGLSYQLKASTDIASTTTNDGNFRKIRMFLKSSWKLYQCSLRGLLLLDDNENKVSYYGGRISELKMNCDQILRQLKCLEENVASAIYGTPSSTSSRVPM